MMRVIAWIFGEYGTTHPDLGTREKIVSRLSDSTYRGWEDHYTVVWIISAITKVHFSLNFQPNTKAAKVFRDFSNSKNLDIQQRCVEYIRLQKQVQLSTNQFLNEKTPMTDEAVVEEGFDFSLSFLDNFV